MSGYKYLPRPRGIDSDDNYISFDFGFWDEASQCFWHANHKRYKDAKRNAADPMKVFQSTKERFVAGYEDFDRIVFCIARAVSYDPRLAVISRNKVR